MGRGTNEHGFSTAYVAPVAFEPLAAVGLGGNDGSRHRLNARQFFSSIIAARQKNPTTTFVIGANASK